ncbi:MAG TPA: pyridoxal 5'-phosphate synthase [Galbitalea sp.]
MTPSPSLRDRLRALPVFPGELPRFDTDAAPADPLGLLVEWLEFALEAGVAQPHAMSIATASCGGGPSNRILLLKDVDAGAVWFASLSTGPKGADLADNPRAALVLYWREQGRQVRITGAVERGPRDVSERDFLQRSPSARARAIAGRQSEPVEDFEAHLAPARELVAAHPEHVPDAWTAYRVIPDSVEFWQAERERDQVRLRYLRVRGEWDKQLLWP